MKNLLKILILLLSVTFCAQAMHEVKRQQEFQEDESKEVIELRELKRRFPHSINFLIKVLGAQKDEQQTFLNKSNPYSKGKSIVIKTGLPNDLILKIINNYLRIDKVRFWDDVVNSKSMINHVISDDTKFYSRHRFNNEDDVDHMELTFRGDQGVGVYNLRIVKYPVQQDGRMYSFATNFAVKFMDHYVLDINSELNTGLELVVEKTQNNKYKVIASLVSIAGLTHYLIKKLKK